MSSRFYKTLRLEGCQTVIVTGIGNRDQLISQLSAESVRAGRKALITSDSDLLYPPEGQFQLGREPHMLIKRARGREPEGPLYLAADLKNDHLVPFRNEEIAEMPAALGEDTILFLAVDSTNKKLLEKFRNVSHLLIICTLDFEPIKVELLDARMDQAAYESGREIQMLKDIEQLLNSMCQSDKWKEVSEEFVLFVNRVNDLFDENLFIPVGRFLRKKGLERIYFGSIQNYEIKAI